MLVTLLVLTSATALGVIAAYATSAEVQTSGTVRATAQAEYVSDYAARAGTDLASQLLPWMRSGAGCPEEFCDPGPGTCTAVELKMYLPDFVNIQTMGTGQPSDVLAPNVGSFGYAPIGSYGVITFDDMIRRKATIAGNSINTPSYECHYRMTVDGSTLEVAAPAAGLDDPHVNTQRVRAFGRVGPIQ